MNANDVLDGQMTLEEKLAAIDAAMIGAAAEFNKRNGRALNAPVDPADLTICEGCS